MKKIFKATINNDAGDMQVDADFIETVRPRKVTEPKGEWLVVALVVLIIIVAVFSNS